MATILALYNSDGCVGRCDAKCHEAKGTECRCICGGKYHGRGGARHSELLTLDPRELEGVKQHAHEDGLHLVVAGVSLVDLRKRPRQCELF